MFVDRITERSKVKNSDGEENVYITAYEVVEKITEEIISEYRDIVNDVTLNKVPINALEIRIIKIINKYNFKVVGKTRNELMKEVMDNIFNYGIMQKYIDTKDFNALFINAENNIWVQNGKHRKRIKESFGTKENLISFIRTIQAKLGGELNENNPLVKFDDAIAKLRIVCGIPPVANPPFVVFRKQPDEPYNLQDLINLGMLTEELSLELMQYHEAGANIIFCGRGGAGKTTLMGAMLNNTRKDMRILLMQEQHEIDLDHPNLISMIVKRNEIGKVIGLQDITDKGLLMSIERYVFGEIRGEESFPLFKGSLSGNITYATTHASSARDVIEMLMLNMKLAGTDLDSKTLKDILFKSINIVVFLDAFRVAEVVEIVNENEDEKEKFNDLWSFDIDKREATFIEGTHRKVGQIKSKAMKEKLKNVKLQYQVEHYEEGVLNYV